MGAKVGDEGVDKTPLSSRVTLGPHNEGVWKPNFKKALAADSSVGKISDWVRGHMNHHSVQDAPKIWGPLSERTWSWPVAQMTDKGVDARVDTSKFRPWPWSFQPKWPWMSPFTSLSVSLIFCRVTGWLVTHHSGEAHSGQSAWVPSPPYSVSLWEWDLSLLLCSLEMAFSPTVSPHTDAAERQRMKVTCTNVGHRTKWLWAPSTLGISPCFIPHQSLQGSAKTCHKRSCSPLCSWILFTYRTL